ncbi:MAG: sigma-70 family RNA polymerase sigma factor [Planctomycetes bacterium]|nr:sigma-70 family RNA polymerase sigma factor [Planctomycetota bacterium]
MTDSSLPLVTQARADDREAIERLLVRHLPRLQAWLGLRMGAQLRARETPEDLVQSVAREVLEDLGGFEWRSEASFRHWLFLRAQRKLVDKARHVGAEQRSPARERPLETPSGEVPHAGRWLTPSGEAASLEEVRRIEQAFATLSDDYREAISLRRLCGMSYAEIAERMQRSESAVLNLVHRGLAQLALRLRRLRREATSD